MRRAAGGCPRLFDITDCGNTDIDLGYKIAYGVQTMALTDLLGFRRGGRESGWPRLIEGQLEENRAAAERNAPYFCGVNFARNISIPIRVEVGSADTVCPPMAGFCAFNVMPSKDKDIIIGLGQGHSMLPEIRENLDGWLKQDALP